MVYYPNTFAGLIECYVNAIPYFASSMIGDCLFVILIFGVHYLALQFSRDEGVTVAG
jgi:hypothetical protein